MCLNPRSVVQSCAGTAVGDEKFGGVAAVVGCDWLVVNFRRRPLNSGDESLLQIYFYLNSTRELMPLKTKKPVLCFMFCWHKKPETDTITNPTRTPTKTPTLAALNGWWCFQGGQQRRGKVNGRKQEVNGRKQEATSTLGVLFNKYK